MLYPRIFQYSPYTYCLQEESTHFGLSVLTYFRLEVSAQFFRTENVTRIEKLKIFSKNFELYQLFRDNFLYQNVLMFSL